VASGDTDAAKLLLSHRLSVILVANQLQYGGTAVPVNLSIKNAPDEVVRRLKDRAARHHRSLQGELLAIVEDAVHRSGPLAPDEVLARVRQLGLSTPRDAAEMIREDRDGR
jgi:plasmid stability protein